jgi:hypothetical protein
MSLNAAAQVRASVSRFATADERVDANAITTMLRIYMKRRFKPRLDRISEAANSALER